ncbi:MAG: PBP1A family penicillin-binding protein [Coriobacteriales bacterium]|nr:PBP1A family penicillin-binding protein [Coriobacteriales bacterium]
MKRASTGIANRTHRRGRVAAAVLCLVFAASVVATAVVGCSPLPDANVEGAQGRDQTTFIYDRTGKVIAQLHAGQNRIDRKLANIPEDLKDAVVATEDRRFYEHSGVDVMGIIRAVFVNATSGDAKQGGSTITQQYVKNAFFSQEKTLSRKVKEALLARKLEKKYSKDEILELYLNTIYFGHGAYGVEAASRAYFDRTVEDLSLAECALLAGIIKSPGAYSPYIDPKAAKARRDLVLDLMLAEGHITQAERDEAKETPVRVAGLKAPSHLAPYFVEYVKQRLIKDFGEETVYRGGLRVRTTLDLRMQKAAEKAVRERLDRKGDPSAALVAVKPESGEIRAMVGGRDFEEQQFNVAVDGRRQPGSAFKPFVLVTALEEGISPEKRIDARPTTIELSDGPWKVTGADDGSTTARLRRATEKSINAVFAHLIVDLGAEKVADTAKSLGITSPITPVPAIALGGHREGVSPLEMANAFGTLAAGGRRAKPHGIAKVTDAQGTVWYQAKDAPERVVDPAVAYLATDILEGVIDRGTGGAADIGRPAAGKTGTTQEYRDAWFVGYTPQLSTAVWVGYPEAQREMDDVHGITVTGGSFPARIWHDFMTAALSKAPIEDFKRPDGLISAKICTATGLRANEACPERFQGLYLAEHPIEKCTTHKVPPKVEVPDVTGLAQSEAEAALEVAGFTVKITRQESSEVPAGNVLAQSPAGGEPAPKGSAVTITLAEPPSQSGTQPAPLEPVIGAADRARVGEVVTFDAAASAGAIVSWRWDFGDGASASGRTVTHSYSKPGLYTATLTVTDEGGAKASASQQIRVRKAR